MVLLASRGWGPGMLINILQCAGQLPSQRIIGFKVSILPRLRNTSIKYEILLSSLYRWKKCGTETLKHFLEVIQAVNCGC